MNTVNEKLYIGLTTGTIEARLKKHIKDAMTAKRPHAIHNAIRKHGPEHFIIESLFESDDLYSLNRAEEELIKSNNSLSPYGYNLHGGGNAHVVSDETRIKMSLVQRGKKQSEETRLKRSRKLAGRKMSKETLEKAAKARSKSVIEMVSGKTFESVNAAAKYFNIRARGISKNLHGKSNHYFGLNFKFMENLCR
jgi:group I intron endonuclease